MKYDLIKLQKEFKQVGIDVGLVDEATIRQLNKIHRGVDEPTTVLSFYQGQVTPEGTFRLGEILICPKRAKKKGLSIKFLLSHGLNNLLSEIPAAKNLRAGRDGHP